MPSKLTGGQGPFCIQRQWLSVYTLIVSASTRVDKQRLTLLSKWCGRMQIPDKFFTRQELVNYLNGLGIPVSIHQLRRKSPDNPPYYKYGQRVVYKLSEVHEWIDSLKKINNE